MTNRTAQIKNTHAALLVRCFDFSPPPGWLQIVNKLLEDIAQILREAEVPSGVFSIRQVKQKLGGLRVYSDGYPQVPTSERDYETEIGSTPLHLERNWHFEGVCSISFEERIDDASLLRILDAISAAAFLPDHAARQITQKIDSACDVADRTCELCGAAGSRIVDNGWHMTVCAEHRNSAAREAWWKERESLQ